MQTHRATGLITLFVVCTLFGTLQAQLDPSLLSIFSIDPAEPNWPVVMAAVYSGTNVKRCT